jgi:hypothetical protein
MSLCMNNEQLRYQTVHLEHFDADPAFIEYQDSSITNFDEKLVLQLLEIR